MRILVLGGTRFLSRAIAAAAVARGHAVTCAARGASGPVPEGADHVPFDRTDPDWSGLSGSWDAVVDVARTPSWVHQAVAALADRVGHWTFVSSISVYADHATKGGSPAHTPLLPAAERDEVQDSAEAYGSAKVACEQAVLAALPAALIARPGLIIGPGDPSGRFTYWAERLDHPDTEVLAPDSPTAPTQVIDVRDLGEWIVAAAEIGLGGVFDTVGPERELGDLLGELAPTGQLTWVPAEVLQEQAVEHWAGPRSLPLWLPPEETGLAAHDVHEFLATRPVLRPAAASAADVVAWLSGNPEAPRTGLTRDEEAAVLRHWHTIRA